MVQLGWNPYTVESELNIGKGQVDPLIVKLQTTKQCIMCMFSVFTEHKQSLASFDISLHLSFMNVKNVQKW